MMKPVEFEGQTTVFHGGEIVAGTEPPLLIEGSVNDRTLTSVWQLDDDERKAIADGANIELCTHGATTPPVSLAVSHRKVKQGMTGAEVRAKLERLCKWRKLLAGWQLGTRSDKDPEAAAVRDHREATIVLRAEVTTLVGLLLAKGLITEAEWLDALGEEADRLNADFESRFPGVTAHDYGLSFEPAKIADAGWAAEWKP